MEKPGIVDGHCDSIAVHLAGERDLALTGQGGQLDLPGLRQAGVRIQFFASFIESSYKPGNSLVRGLELIEGCRKLIEENPDYLLLLQNSADIAAAEATNRTAVLLSVEGGEVLDSKRFMLSLLYRLGIRSICLTWNQANSLAGGVNEPGGLTSFGLEVIQEMNRLGMLIDVSHLSEQAFWDVIAASKQPVIASHSCCRSVCDHPRNLSDSQIKALAHKGGLVGINFYGVFLTGGDAAVKDVVRHIHHICSLVGPEYVGIGSDFDGCDNLPHGLEHVACLPVLTESLLESGLGFEETANIMGGNFVRVIQQVIG